MNIISTQYTLVTKSFEIYVAGCKGQPHCKGCHNPDTWNFNIGEPYIPYYHKYIKTKLTEFDSMINNIMIFGGEPLDQPIEEISSLIWALEKYKKDIWLFTRYPIEEVPTEIKESCNYIKCGRYIEELLTDNHIEYGVTLASSNQHIYKKGTDY